jgi:peptidoglycan hydrolase-like protein with peptidoglycan-binding domain/subtilisin family serine protease
VIYRILAWIEEKVMKNIKKLVNKGVCLLLVSLVFFVFVGQAEAVSQLPIANQSHNKASDNNILPYIEPEIDLNDSKVISVILEIEEESIAVQEAEAKEKGQRYNPRSFEESIDIQLDEIQQEIEDKDIDASILSEFKQVFNGITVELPANKIADLASIPGVTAIYETKEYTVLNNNSGQTSQKLVSEHIQADHLWEAGYTGEGVTIALIDTGIDYNHPDLKEAYKGGRNFVNDGRSDPYEGNDKVTSTHGTNVAGVLAANGNPETGGVKGIAYNSDLYVYRVIDSNGRGNTSWVIAAIEQAVKDGADVINLSLGREHNQSDTPLTRAVNNAVRSGTVVVVANGNDGSNKGTVGDPATAALAISVGATRLTGGVSGAESLEGYSSRGPVSDSADIKPDVVAPGGGIYSTASLGKIDNYSKAYGIYSGTSMAAPMTTGVAALLIEANPGWGPAEVKSALMNTAEILPGYSVNDIGAGSIRGKAAYDSPVHVLVSELAVYTQGNKKEEIKHFTGSMNFGTFNQGEESESTKAAIIKNQTDETLEYEADWYFTAKSVSKQGVNLSLDRTITLSPGERKEIAVSLSADGQAKPGYYEGYVSLESDGNPHITLPFGLEVLNVSEGVTYLLTDRTYFNQDAGKLKISYGLGEMIERVNISLLDYETSEPVGLIFDEKEDFVSREYEFDWDLKYLNYQTNKRVSLKDGRYLLRVTATDSYSRTYFQETELLVQSVPPVIALDSKMADDVYILRENVIKGKVSSAFLDARITEMELTIDYSLEKDGKVFKEEKIALSDDGLFVITEDLKYGENNFTAELTDPAGNTAKIKNIIYFYPELKKGDSGDGVLELKHNLGRAGFHITGEEASYFGDETRKAIKDFQSYYLLDGTGVLDEPTLLKLIYINNSIYQDGQNGDHVVKLKEDLTRAGFIFPSNPSPVYGNVTERRVREFQEYYGLRVNGIGDEVTLAKLESITSSIYSNGKEGAHVVILKEDLTRAGFTFPANPSAVYGSVTERRVREFQEYYGLRANGIGDKVTLAKLESVLLSTYSNGQEGAHVVKLKEDLTEAGFTFPSNPSPVYGNVTERRVREFQEYYDLRVNGIGDEVTLAKLESVLSSVYRNGQEGAHVVKLKERLTTAGFTFPSNPSPVYGNVTERRVMEFQEYYGLRVNGIGDEVTRAKLESIISSKYRNGQEGTHVVKLKEDLTTAGFTFPSNPSPVYGNVTERRVREFQEYYGLRINGIGDEVTLTKLESILTSKYRNGQSGGHVVKMKKDLTLAGFSFPRNPSTVYGNVTERRVREFQEDHGLRINGIGDRVTLSKLNKVTS